MFTRIQWIIIGVLALVLVFAGYSFGARKVNSLEAQIESIRVAGEKAKADAAKMQQDIAKMTEQKEAEFQKRVAELNASAEDTQKKLAAAAASAPDKVKAAQQEIDRLNARRKQLEADLAAATDAEKKRLIQASIDQGNQAERIQELVKRGNECLAVPVPHDNIAPFLKNL